MNKRRLITRRICVTAVLLLVQAVLIFTWLNGLLAEYGFVIPLINILGALYILYIVSKDDNAEYRIAWILLIAVIPVFGALLYLFYGDKKPSKLIRAGLEKCRPAVRALLPDGNAVSDMLGCYDMRLRGISEYVRGQTGCPVYNATETVYFRSGEDMLPVLLAELDKAEHFIFLEYFIICEGLMWNAVLDILKRKAEDGVDIRIIYDDMGCFTKLPPDYAGYLNSLHRNIKCAVFNRVRLIMPVSANTRDHRKIAVIDGNTAFTGGLNMADEYINETHPFGYWKDSAVMLRGTAALGFTSFFLEFWHALYPKDILADGDMSRFLPGTGVLSDGFVQPYTDSPLDSEPVGENVYIEILAAATDYVYITTPYLAIGSELRTALRNASKRGVDVRLVLPGIPDKKLVYRLSRSYYPPLLRSGVRIYEYTPGFLHAKSYVSDDKIAAVGSINMDFRSFYLHFECGVILYGCSSVTAVRDDIEAVINDSREITLSRRHKSFFGKLFDRLLRLFAPLI